MTVDGEVVGSLARPGLLVYLGVTHTDGPAEVDWMARKIWGLRILRDEQSASDVGAPVLWSASSRCTATPARAAVPPGRPPHRARSPSRCTTRSAPSWPTLGAHVERGVFGADMRVESVNDGPFTVLLER